MATDNDYEHDKNEEDKKTVNIRQQKSTDV